MRSIKISLNLVIPALCSIIISMFYCDIAYASSLATFWKDTWQRRDQQGMTLMQQKRYKEAADAFQNSQWKATAAYRQGDYQKAAKLYSTQHNETALYNLGNALAYLKQYPEAIEAYKKALAINPKDKDAIYNKALIEKLLKKNPPTPPQSSPNKENNSDKKNSTSDSSSSPSQSPSKPKDKNQPTKPNPSTNPAENKTQSIPKKPQQNKSQKAERKQQQEQEAQQAKSQWLKLVPEHPGGLLRQQFMRDHLRRKRGESS